MCGYRRILCRIEIGGCRLLAMTSSLTMPGIIHKEKIMCIVFLLLKYLKLVELSTSRMGFQGKTEEDINTIPILDTVAGLALSTLSGSKTSFELEAMTIRSPLANVKVLLSSKTELRFSIQTASTGPSNTNLE